MDGASELELADRMAADVVAADEARKRLREQGIVTVEPDERIGVMLGPGERVLSRRLEVAVERRKENRDPGQSLRGDLYVTTARLICIGPVQVDVSLLDVSEAVVGPGSLRLVVGNGRGLEIRTPDPYLLRVEIAAARQVARSTVGCPGATSEPADSPPPPDQPGPRR